MKTLLKLAVGAAIAGALVNLLRKQQSRRDADLSSVTRPDQSLSAGSGRVPPGSRGFTLEEIAGENAEWGGGSSGLNA